MSKAVQITFNKDLMSVKDLKDCAGALDSVFQALDQFGNDPKEFLIRVLQYRDSYRTSREDN